MEAPLMGVEVEGAVGFNPRRRDGLKTGVTIMKRYYRLYLVKRIIEMPDVRPAAGSIPRLQKNQAG